MNNLIIVRHGQSVWNAQNKFTGWVNVDLSNKGKKEAQTAGKLLGSINLKNLHAFTSFLDRAIETLNIIIKNAKISNISIQKAWQLNERHYGSLTGLNKEETKNKLGEKLYLKYRRSWDTKPPDINYSKNQQLMFGELFKKIPKSSIPYSESLKDTYNRVIPYFNETVIPLLKNNRDVLIVAHGNSLRALCKKIFNIDNKTINLLEIPTGNPMHIILEDDFTVNKTYYLDNKRGVNIIKN